MPPVPLQNGTNPYFEYWEPGGRPYITWRAAAGATRYELCVYPAQGQTRVCDQGFSSTTIPGNATSFRGTVPNQPGQRYFASLKACNRDGCSGFNTVLYLILPSAPQLQSPARAATLPESNRTVQFQWTDQGGRQRFAGFRVFLRAGNDNDLRNNPRFGGSTPPYRSPNSPYSGWRVYAAPDQNTRSMTITVPPELGNQIHWRVAACQSYSGPQDIHCRSYDVFDFQFSTTSTSTPPAAAISFSRDLYPLITTQCGGCHQGNYQYPQMLQTNASRCGVTTAPSIPFSTTMPAAEMYRRLTCLQASSRQNTYQRALGKVYVVPGNPNNSGLHWKAQDSTATTFSQNITIGGQQKPVKEWIRLWIEQGAAQ